MEHEGRKILTIIIALLAVISFFAGSAILQSQGNSISNNSGLNGNITLGSQVSYIEAWNGQSYTQVTITSHTGTSVVFTVPTNTTLIYLFTANSKDNVGELLGNGTTFLTADITAGNTTHLTSAYAYLAGIHNSSSNNAVGDHGLTNVVDNLTLYNSNTNNLGTSQQFSILNMLSGDQKATLQYAIYLRNTSSPTTLTVTGQQQYAMHINIKQDLEYTAMLLFLASFILAIFSFPKVKGIGNVTVKRREAVGIVLVAIVFGIVYAIANFLGSYSTFIGVGLPYEAAFGFAIGLYFYGMMEEEGRFDIGFLMGVVGLAVVVAVSAYFPFLAPLGNLAGYDIGGAITALLAVLTDLVLSAGGLAATKHSHFGE